MRRLLRGLGQHVYFLPRGRHRMNITRDYADAERYSGFCATTLSSDINDDMAAAAA